MSTYIPEEVESHNTVYRLETEGGNNELCNGIEIMSLK
jgi:hypothetical protein